MNTSIKKKVNLLGLIGMIIAIIMAITGIFYGAQIIKENIIVIRDSHKSSIDALILDNLGIGLEPYVFVQEGNTFYFYDIPEDAEPVDLQDGNTEIPENATLIHASDGTTYLTYQITDDAYPAFSREDNTFTFETSRNRYFSTTVDDPEAYVAELKSKVTYSNFLAIGRIIGSLNAIAVYVFLILAADAFRRCDNPFEERVIRRLRIFAWVLLAHYLISALFSLAGTFFPYLFHYGYEIVYPVTKSGSLELLMSVVSTFTSLLIPMIMLFIVRVFRHGAELQKESDETL